MKIKDTNNGERSPPESEAHKKKSPISQYIRKGHIWDAKQMNCSD